MRLQIIISRLSNFLFLAQKTVKFSLVKFNLQKYLTTENFDLFFYGKSENKIWEEIEKSIGEQNVKQIKKSVVLSNPVFASHWDRGSKDLFLWKQYFLNNQSLFEQIMFKIKELNGVKYFVISEIPIYLISDSSSKDKEINAWFSWTPKESFVVIEIPFGLKMPNNFFPLSVLAHEFFHLILRKNKNLFLKISENVEKNKKLFTKLSEGMPNRIFLEELLVSSFIPEGYLNEKYFHIKVADYIKKPKNLLAWRQFIASKLYQTAKNYINNTSQIDEKYLEYLTAIIKQNAK